MSNVVSTILESANTTTRTRFADFQIDDDSLGDKAKAELEARSLTVKAARRPAPTRKAWVHLDSAGERTITTIGERLEPSAGEPLGWAELKRVDAVYFTAGDAAALRAARAARHLVATVRAGTALTESGVQLDVLLASANDSGESYRRGELNPPPRFLVRTDGAGGGGVEAADGLISRWEAAPLPGPRADSYGAGDSFAGGLTYGLARGDSITAAIALAARCGAAAVSGHGPYDGQLTRPD